MTSIGTTETPWRSNRDTVANITTCEPSNVTTTFTRVAGWQSIVDKAQKHNIFVKVPSCCVGSLRLTKRRLKRLLHCLIRSDETPLFLIQIKYGSKPPWKVVSTRMLIWINLSVWTQLIRIRSRFDPLQTRLAVCVKWVQVLPPSSGPEQSLSSHIQRKAQHNMDFKPD